MPAQFEAIIRETLTRGAPSHHEIALADLGAGASRIGMLQDCLRVLLKHYPGLGIALAGSDATLRQMGMAPGVGVPIGDRQLNVVLRANASDDRLRLLFSRL